MISEALKVSLDYLVLGKSHLTIIVTINTSDPKQSVAAFAMKNEINYPVLLNGSKVAKSFQISACPSFYLIDKNGMIAATFAGYSKELENELIQKIDNLNSWIK